jgi:hypothetical protein
MFRLILMALSLFEAAGPGWDPDGSPAPQGGDAGPTTDGGSGWDPNG